MANATYIGREVTLTLTPSGGGALVIGVAELAEIEVTNDLEEVMALGSELPQDIKEGGQHVKFTLRKAFIGTDFWNRIDRDSNGYLTEFTIEYKYTDKSGGGAGVGIKHTATGCKAQKWGKSVASKGGVALETLEGIGKDHTRATF